MGKSVVMAVALESMRNLGPVSAGWLRQIGVGDRAQLAQMGPVAAYFRVKQCQPLASVNLLWALAAALADKDLRDVSTRERQQLHDELRALLNSVGLDDQAHATSHQPVAGA